MSITWVARIAGVMAFVIFIGGCQRQAALQQPPVADGFLQAEAALRAGDYARADDLYRLLGEDRTGALREITLSRRALIYALPGTPLQNSEQSQAFLDQLLLEFPDTTMHTETEALLAVLPTVAALRASVARGLEEIAELSAAIDTDRMEREQLRRFLASVSPFAPEFDLERARAEYRSIIRTSADGLFREIAERMLFLLSQWERLDALGASPEVTLRQLRRELSSLRDELETLKEIDLGRRLPN